MKICFFIVKFVSHVVELWQTFHDFFIFLKIFWYRFHHRWLHFDVFFVWKSNYMLVKLKKNMIKKSHFFVSNPPYVERSWISKSTLLSSMGETHRKWTKVVSKNLFLQYVRMVKFWIGSTIGKMKIFLFKILKILPTCDSFLKIEFHIEITYGWNPSFFSKNDQILLDSPIGKKDPISTPHPPFM